VHALTLIYQNTAKNLFMIFLLPIFSKGATSIL
jgi:hypothetical protein